MKGMIDEALAQTGLTYRRLDHWTRKGYLRAQHDGGSGISRSWPEPELRIAALMVRLVAAGFEVARAADIARTAVDEATEGGYAVVWIGRHIGIEIGEIK